MIFDRTADDVRKALIIRKTKVQNNQALTAQEVETLERGFLTLNTLNRIESKQEEIKRLINDIGYYNAPVLIKSWKVSDVFTKKDLERIINNNKMLGDAFFVYNPNLLRVLPRYHYSEINSLERLLYDLATVISDIVSDFRECGTFYCGEDDETAEALWYYDSSNGNLAISDMYVIFEDQTGNININLPYVEFFDTTGELSIGG